MVPKEDYMSNIIQFPDVREQREIEKQMEATQVVLSELYDALEKIERGHISIKDRTLEIEDEYQTLIQMYADIVGVDNVAVKWLEYCGFVSMEKDPETGKLTISFVPPDENDYEE
tara:strand:+ start:2314 stop:2658 length:345 start_codon:yes stop_codon:yes gene_type:complete